MADPACPAGLQNLGNTCYLNAALQVKMNQCGLGITAYDRSAAHARATPYSSLPTVQDVQLLQCDTNS